MSHNHTNCSIIHRPGNAIYNLDSFLDAYKTAFQRSWNLSIDRKLLAVREKPFPVLRRKKSGWKYNNSSPQPYGFFSEFSSLKTVHFTTMPCEPETGFGHKESKIFMPGLKLLKHFCTFLFMSFAKLFVRHELLGINVPVAARLIVLLPPFVFGYPWRKLRMPWLHCPPITHAKGFRA